MHLRYFAIFVVVYFNSVYVFEFYFLVPFDLMLSVKSESVNHAAMSDFFVTPWIATHQAPLSIEFSRQEYWSGLPCPSPVDLPNPGIEPGSSAIA